MAVKNPVTPQEPRSRTPKLISRKIQLAALALGLFLFYAAGVFVRSNRGIRIVVENKTEITLRDANIVVEQGGPYLLGEIAAGKKKKIFIVPGNDSRIRASFTDQNGQRHSEIVAGYVENGYCGDVTVRVLPNLMVSVHDDSFAVWNWKSWYSFYN
jgi:hypothetical protein